MTNLFLLRCPPRVPSVSTPLSLFCLATARKASERLPGITTVLRPVGAAMTGLADLSKVGTVADVCPGDELDGAGTDVEGVNDVEGFTALSKDGVGDTDEVDTTDS